MPASTTATGAAARKRAAAGADLQGAEQQGAEVAAIGRARVVVVAVVSERRAARTGSRVAEP